MTVGRWALTALRICLAVLFAILVLLETMSLPGQFAHMAAEAPERAHLRWPLTAVTVFWVLCVQVILICAWQLLTLVARDRIFTASALRWVDIIVGVIGAGWVVLVGVFLFAGVRADDPGLPLLLFLLVMVGAVLGLLMIVMRALLRQATALRTDMEAVI